MTTIAEVLNAAEQPPNYPRELEKTLILRDGVRVAMRPLVPDDADTLAKAMAEADSETLYQRFFTRRPRMDLRQMAHFTRLDYHWRLALAAIHQGELVAILRYEGTPETREAEVGLVVTPSWRRRGLAGRMFEELEQAAVARGIRRFNAYYLEHNEAIAALLGRFAYAPPRVASGVAETYKDLARS